MIALTAYCGRGLGEQLEANAAGVAGLCQLVEHLGIVDLTRARLRIDGPAHLQHGCDRTGQRTLR